METLWAQILWARFDNLLVGAFEPELKAVWARFSFA